MRLRIGLDRAGFIEKNPELFADGEKFRLYHKKARTNTILFTFASYVVGLGALYTFMPHLHAQKFVNAYKPIVCVAALGYAAASY